MHPGAHHDWGVPSQADAVLHNACMDCMDCCTMHAWILSHLGRLTNILGVALQTEAIAAALNDSSWLPPQNCRIPLVRESAMSSPGLTKVWGVALQAGAIAAALKDNPGFSLKLLGHSLGAGTAAIAAMLIRNSPEVLLLTDETHSLNLEGGDTPKPCQRGCCTQGRPSFDQFRLV